MVRHLLILFLLLFALGSAAQKDLIITQAGKEIRCKILEETSMRFSYAYINEKQQVVQTEIFKTLVSSFKFDYYPSDILPNEKLFKGTGKPIQKNEKTPQKKASSESEKKKSDSVKKTPSSTKNDSTPAEDHPEVTDASTKKEKKSSTPEKAVAENSNPTSKKETPSAPLENSNQQVSSLDKETQSTSNSPLKTEIVTKAEKDQSPDKMYLAPKPLPGRSEFKNFLKYRFGLKAGLANLMETTTNKTDYDLYKEKLRRGWVFGADAAYFVTDNIGVGVTFHSFNSKNKKNTIDFPHENAGGATRTGSLDTKVTHRFVGPTMLYRTGLDFKTFLIATVSPGINFFQEKGITNDLAYKNKGNSFGAAATLGLDFLIGNDFYGRDVILSIECGYNYGQIKKITNRDGQIVNPNYSLLSNGLNRLDFSVGLRFTKFPRSLK